MRAHFTPQAEIDLEEVGVAELAVYEGCVPIDGANGFA
jgi:hypothetical protein